MLHPSRRPHWGVGSGGGQAVSSAHSTSTGGGTEAHKGRPGAADAKSGPQQGPGRAQHKADLFARALGLQPAATAGRAVFPPPLPLTPPRPSKADLFAAAMGIQRRDAPMQGPRTAPVLTSRRGPGYHPGGSGSAPALPTPLAPTAPVLPRPITLARPALPLAASPPPLWMPMPWQGPGPRVPLRGGGQPHGADMLHGGSSGRAQAAALGHAHSSDGLCQGSGSATSGGAARQLPGAEPQQGQGQCSAAADDWVKQVSDGLAAGSSGKVDWYRLLSRLAVLAFKGRPAMLHHHLRMLAHLRDQPEQEWAARCRCACGELLDTMQALGCSLADAADQWLQAQVPSSL